MTFGKTKLCDILCFFGLENRYFQPDHVLTYPGEMELRLVSCTEEYLETKKTFKQQSHIAQQARSCCRNIPGIYLALRKLRNYPIRPPERNAKYLNKGMINLPNVCLLMKYQYANKYLYCHNNY